MLIVAPPTRWVEGGGRHFKQSNVSGENRCIPLPLFLKTVANFYPPPQTTLQIYPHPIDKK